MSLNIAVCLANSVDPDQMPCCAASDLGLHCLQRLTVPLPMVITVPSDVCTQSACESAQSDQSLLST